MVRGQGSGWWSIRTSPAVRARSAVATTATSARPGGSPGIRARTARCARSRPGHALLVTLPDAIDDAAGVLLEPLGIALHALDLSGARAGQRAGVFGCGPIGLALIRLLVASGIEIAIATDRREHRLAAAAASGVEATRLVDDGGPPAADPPVDVAFEASGEDGALEDAMRAVRPGGRVVLVGIPSGPRTSFVADVGRRKELALVFCRRMRATDLPRAIDLVVGGRVDLGGLVTDRYPLAEAPRAFERLATRDGLKVIIRPDT